MDSKSFLLVLIAAVSLTALAGFAYAAQENNGGGTNFPVSCMISPAPVSLSVGANTPISVSCGDAGGARVPCPEMQWSSTIGSVSSASDPSLFVAGTVAGPGTITARSPALSQPSFSCSAPVSISPGGPSVVKIKPPAASVTAGSTQQFSAQVFDQYNNPIISAEAANQYRWEVLGGIGKIDASGIFTAVTEGKGQVAATYENTPSLRGITGTAEVTVSAAQAPVAYCQISPSSASVAVTQQHALTLTCYDGDPRLMNIRGVKQIPCPNAIWSATGGTIAPSKDPSGIDAQSAIFSAGKTSGTATITASEDSPRMCAGCVMTCTSEISILPGSPRSVSVSPSASSLYVSDRQSFAATASDEFGNTITGAQFSWSFSDSQVGTIDQSGAFTASSVGTGTVRAETVGPSLTQPYGTATVSISNRPSGETGGGSGGNNDGGSTFSSSSIVSYTCAGKPALLTIRIYRANASALVKLYYASVQPYYLLFSVNASNNQTVPFTPNATGSYELRVNVGTEQRTAAFSIPECTPATVNITKNVSIELQGEPKKNVTITPPSPTPGKIRDSHGCPTSDGYAWCDSKQKCIRSGVETCPTASSGSGSDSLLGVPLYIWIIAAAAVIVVAAGAFLVFGGKKQ